MGSRLRASLIAPILTLTFSSVMLAQTAAAPQAAKPQPPVPVHDLSGVWNVVGGTLRPDKISPMLPEAQKRFDENTAELKKGLPITKDPAFNCLPAGVPHMYQNGVYPFEIVQTPQRIFIFYESQHNWREIWMDGRQIPKDADPTWMGNSVGHWDGNDLVVETGNFNDRTWLDPAGHPHSEALHVTERFRRVAFNNLQIEFTIDDPKSYTQPWTMRASFPLKPGWEIGESYCLQEDQDNFRKNILTPNAK
jgi:hypothetical protein